MRRYGKIQSMPVWKRVVSLFLAVFMVLTMTPISVPTTAKAADIVSPEVNGTSVTFRYDNASASTVCLAGSMNGWNMTSTPLSKGQDGVWPLTLTDQAAGNYEYKFIVDGNWTKDPLNNNYTGDNNAYTIACDIMAKIDSDEAYRGILSVYDYSILTLSHYTDDNAAGVKLSLVLQMPSPLNWCELDENFDDEEHEEEKDHEIDIDETEVGDIDITPIKLPKNRNC